MENRPGWKLAKIAEADRPEQKIAFVEPAIVKRGTLPQMTWGPIFSDHNY